MGSENSTWQTMRKAFKNIANVRLTRNEDKFDVGKPDVTFGMYAGESKWTGFIELKYLERFPPRKGIVKIEHYTKEQKTWLLEQGEIGGRCFLFCQVGREYFLFDHKVAQQIGDVKEEYWREFTLCHRKGKIDPIAIMICISALY